jgi:hypothetical protein
MMIGIDMIIAATTAAMTDVTTTIATTATTDEMTTEAIAVMITAMIVTTTNETTGVMIDVARTTTVPATTTARSGLHRHRPKGQPQWCVPEGQPRDQFHHGRSPSDQKQPTDSIKRQGDRSCQYRESVTSAVV